MSKLLRRSTRTASLAAITVSALTLTACGGGTAGSSAADSPTSGTVNLIAYSGIWQDNYTKAVIEPFEKKYPDIKVNFQAKRSSADMLSTLQSEASHPATDVTIMDRSVSESGNQTGLFAKFGTTDVPNLANVKKEFLHADGYGPVDMLDAIALLYNTDAVKTAPTSWKTLWDHQYAGRINLTAPPSLLGVAMTAITSEMEGEDFTKSITKGTAKLKQLKHNVLTFSPNPDEYQSVITGETVLGLGQNARGQYYKDQSGGKLGLAFPKEGTAYQINTINLLKNAPDSAAAKTFINYALSPEAQRAFAETLFYAPSITNADLPADVAKRVVSTDGSIKIIPLDTKFLSAVRDPWTAVWKREITG